jgi:hypothetical protein
MAGKIEQPSDLWELEVYLTQSRKAIDRKTASTACSRKASIPSSPKHP